MVDEDISRRTITLSIRMGKLTARTLAWALRAAGRKIHKERQVRKTPHGRQSVKQLMRQGEATNSLPVEAPREFDRVARRWNVDYAFYNNGEHHIPGRAQAEKYLAGRKDEVRPLVDGR